MTPTLQRALHAEALRPIDRHSLAAVMRLRGENPHSLGARCGVSAKAVRDILGKPLKRQRPTQRVRESTAAALAMVLRCEVTEDGRFLPDDSMVGATVEEMAREAVTHLLAASGHELSPEQRAAVRGWIGRTA